MKQPKPFFRKFTGTWYVQIGKKQVNLGPDKRAAWAKYHEIMADRKSLSAALVTVSQLFERYLDWCQKRCSRGTYENARLYCRSFIGHVGKKFLISRLKPKHISSWMDAHPSWTSTTQNDAISIIQRTFNWAVKQGHLDRSPIRHVEDKPSRQRREVVYTPEQWDEIMTYIPDQQFRDLMTFMWETGCRPIEARMLEARHLDLKNGIAVFPPSEAKGHKTGRVIFLTEPALEICRWLCEQHAAGPIFLNTRGRPWTKDSVKCRFSRLKQKVDLPVLCAYGIRHSYATEGLKNGVDSLSLASLMGHSDVSMIARVYQHLSKNPEFLREQARKAKGA